MKNYDDHDDRDFDDHNDDDDDDDGTQNKGYKLAEGRLPSP